MEQPKQKQSMVESRHFQDENAVNQAREMAANAQTDSERIIWENRLNQRVEALEKRLEKIESLGLK